MSPEERALFNAEQESALEILRAHRRTGRTAPKPGAAEVISLARAYTTGEAISDAEAGRLSGTAADEVERLTRDYPQGKT
jgi:hypothetical protein